MKEKKMKFYGNELNSASDEVREVKAPVEEEPVAEEKEEAVEEQPVVREGVATGDFKFLNVRSSASAKSEKNIIAQIENGARVTIVSDHKDFLFVKFDTGKGIGGEGYVMKKFIKEV